MHIDKKFELLEKIEVFVGIDIAKNTHYASFLTKTGKILKTGLAVKNSREGFTILLNELEKHDQNVLIIGLEPTGHYWIALYEYFINLGYTIMLVNPYHTKLCKEQYDNHQSKNDPKDSVLIARMIREGKFTPHLGVDGPYANLRVLTIAREDVALDLKRATIKLKTLLDQYLPEYEKLFPTVSIKSSLAFLRTFGISGIQSSLCAEEKITLLRTKSHSAINHERATKIVQSLAQTVGSRKAIDAVECRLKSLLDRIALFERNIAELEQQIELQLERTNEYRYLKSIKGIAVVTAGTFLGQIGSLSNYRHPRQIEKASGLMLAAQSSGTHDGKPSISKRGRSLLRYILHRIAVLLVAHDKGFKKFYEHKTKVLKKEPLVALVAISIKFINVIFGMVKNKIEYDGSLLFKGLSDA